MKFKWAWLINRHMSIYYQNGRLIFLAHNSGPLQTLPRSVKSLSSRSSRWAPLILLLTRQKHCGCDYGKRERGEVRSSRMQPLSPDCQFTWWMNQFHINLMLSSYNWIIYTAQRHMGSDHLNPRWALDFCSQAIGLWPTVNISVLCWLSQANQLSPLEPDSGSSFLSACCSE